VIDDAGLVRELEETGREVAARGLSWGAAGNLSALAGEGTFLISAAGVRLGELGRDRIVACRLDGADPAGGPRPSTEVEMHRAVYAAVPEARAVLHTSAPCTTLLACSRLRVPVQMNTDALIYVGQVRRVGYRHPGTHELASAAASQARRSRVLLLDNHGSLVWGESLAEVLTRTEALEFLARLLLTARAARVPLAHLPDEAVARFGIGSAREHVEGVT
jgi:ribulose-5-phosphate 4-epimerase/fuculose-1-phosphate aldolase